MRSCPDTDIDPTFLETSLRLKVCKFQANFIAFFVFGNASSCTMDFLIQKNQ